MSFFTYYLWTSHLDIFDTNYIMYKNVIIFKEKKIVKENTYSFGIFFKKLFLTWNIQNSLIILQTCVEASFVLH